LDLIPFFVVLPFSPIVVSSFDKKEEYGNEEEYKNHQTDRQVEDLFEFLVIFLILKEDA
jgi:hypothetical protein